MNATQAENLRILIRYMETKVTVPTLDMSTITHNCGTPACAMGHARLCSELRERGMPLDGLAVVARGFFGMDGEESYRHPTYWGRLFGSWLSTGGNLVGEPTPHQWAAEARKVLDEQGYSMDEQPADDGFRRLPR
jgi:hypothetical protein